MEATQAGQINAQQTIHRHLRPLTHQPRTRTLSEWPISLSECHWGVALARAVLAADGIEAGLLVRPFDLLLPTEYAYYVVCLKELAQQPEIKAFREWIVGEAQLSGYR